MATITVPEETFQRLSRKAEVLQTTVEALATPALESVAGLPTPLPFTLSYEEWKKLFDEHMAEVAARADRYPPGFEVDISRESMYEGCGE